MSLSDLATLAKKNKESGGLSPSLSSLSQAIPALQVTTSRKAGTYLSLPLNGEVEGIDLSGLSPFTALVIALQQITPDQLLEVEQGNLLKDIDVSLRTWDDGGISLSFFAKKEEDGEKKEEESSKGSGSRRNRR